MRKLQRAWREMTACSAERDASYIAELVQKHATTVVWFGHGQISFPLIRAVKALLPDIKVVCDTDSVWSRFILRELPFQPNPLRRRLIAWRGRRKEKEERQWVNLCEITTAVSEIDAAYYRESAIDPRRVRIFANAIDIENYTSNPQPPPDLKKPCIYLAGTFGHYHSPMDVAARWVLDEVLPRLRRRIPDIHFYIVGRDSDRTLAHRADKHVSVKGMLASVLPYLRHADVAIVPLKFESGTRFKILEAGACGVPLVSTTLGAEGIGVSDRENILVADTAEAFAAAIVEIFKNPDYARTLGRRLHDLVAQRYSLDAQKREGQSIIRFLEERNLARN